jgi:hypothetical protein
VKTLWDFFFLLTLKVLRRDAIFLLALPVVNVENAPEILLPEVPLLEKKKNANQPGSGSE